MGTSPTPTESLTDTPEGLDIAQQVFDSPISTIAGLAGKGLSFAGLNPFGIVPGLIGLIGKIAVRAEANRRAL